MFESGSLVGLPTEIMARGGIRQIFPLKFQPVLHRVCVCVYLNVYVCMCVCMYMYICAP
jgi:hypothetical protein